MTWNSVAYLERCLTSIEHALSGSGITYEILILDNGSSDGTPQLLTRLAENRGDRIRPYFETANTGTTRSRNRLFREAKGTYVCVMDSDVELATGVIDTLLPILANDRHMGIVAPRVDYPSGAWQKSFDRFPTVTDKINRFLRLREIEQKEGQAMVGRSEPFPVDYLISAFWLMRRDLIDTVGPLDEDFFYAPEDVDFCLRVWKAGFQILYVPSVTIVHHTQEISRGLKLNRAKFAHLKGLAYYFRKHRYWLRRPTFPQAKVIAGERGAYRT